MAVLIRVIIFVLILLLVPFVPSVLSSCCLCLFLSLIFSRLFFTSFSHLVYFSDGGIVKISRCWSRWWHDECCCAGRSSHPTLFHSHLTSSHSHPIASHIRLISSSSNLNSSLSSQLIPSHLVSSHLTSSHLMSLSFQFIIISSPLIRISLECIWSTLIKRNPPNYHCGIISSRRVFCWGLFSLALSLSLSLSLSLLFSLILSQGCLAKDGDSCWYHRSRLSCQHRCHFPLF